MGMKKNPLIKFSLYLSDNMNSIANTTEGLTKSTEMKVMLPIDGVEVKKSQEKQE
ncbi:hypothetical protein H9I32_23675 [Bacillus sp. Xin]|uniref:hypothetical protein n=1 Tax=unclassified Bacillus (in: firmicutes) TaxID=185979 RepID=UPI001573417A|nr:MULTISPECIES: hypothetical protein [unclassified Bacillus (in: firmicutes)]MBC6975254.1 hypothetical protein [Bacillus sp. Xin]NSW36740.1 hypothetical protein [Bacillus sp. Xin1]